MHLFLQILMTKNGKIHSQGLRNCVFFYKIVWYFNFFFNFTPEIVKNFFCYL